MTDKFRVRRTADGWRVHMPHYWHSNLTASTWAEAKRWAFSMADDLARDARERAELGLPARRYRSAFPWDPDW